MKRISDSVLFNNFYLTTMVAVILLMALGVSGCDDNDNEDQLAELEQQLMALQQENRILKDSLTSPIPPKNIDTLEIDTYGELVATCAWSTSYELEKWIARRIQDVKSWARSEEIMSAGLGPEYAESARKFLGDEIINIADFEDAYVVSLTGEMITDEIGYTEPDTESPNAPWRKALEHELYVSDLYLPDVGFSTNYRMDISVPINDITTGEMMGILVCKIQVYPSSLGQEYEMRYPGLQTLIFDNTGKLVVDSQDYKRYLEESPVWSPLEQQVRDAITDDTNYINPEYIVNADVIVGYARASNESVDTRIAGFGGLGWTVVISDEISVQECSYSEPE